MKVFNVGSVLAFTMVVTSLIASAQQAQPPSPGAAGLRIVVLDGEDAVNIVQQKTAVRPIVEIRDSNNLPVAGATVQFTIQQIGGATSAGAFANGQTVFTVTSNAAGRAVSSPLQAIGRGALRIQVQASYQGQVATATVAQTNFATVAEAAQAGRTASVSQSVAGTAASAGSTATGVVAGAAAAGVGGAVATRQAVTDSSCSSSNGTFSSDLAAAFAACGSSSSSQCNAAGQQAANSLGEWCSCAGTAAVETELHAEGTSLAELARLSVFPNVTFPASCH